MQRWDIFCQVVDNFGDIGTCWRLAQQLTAEYQADVRLWVDNLDSFARLNPAISTNVDTQRVGSIEIQHWQRNAPFDIPGTDVADVVIEAFGCELPESYIGAMARRPAAPVWINLEYLSAEPWVEGCHLLTSPHTRLPLTKYFFFPGFTPQTGGVLREGDLLSRRAAFDAVAEADFWRSVGIPPRTADEIRVSLFCYENAAVPELLQHWLDGSERVCVLAAPGAATEQVATFFGCLGKTGGIGNPFSSGPLTVHLLPFLPQAVYDQLLWACDVNFVRGEDSFVRAQWAQRPFVWQIYPQAEDAHLVKLDAFLDKYLAHFPESDSVRHCWKAWNDAGRISLAWRDFIENRERIQRHNEVWAFQLDQAGNLANNLSRFVVEK